MFEKVTERRYRVVLVDTCYRSEGTLFALSGLEIVRSLWRRRPAGVCQIWIEYFGKACRGCGHWAVAAGSRSGSAPCGRPDRCSGGIGTAEATGAILPEPACWTHGQTHRGCRVRMEHPWHSVLDRKLGGRRIGR